MTGAVVISEGDAALILRKDGTYQIVCPAVPTDPPYDTVVLALGVAKALENEEWAAALRRRTLEYIESDGNGEERG